MKNQRSLSQDALEPKMSKKTLEFHWGKHHQAYVTNLNGQIKGTPLEGKPLTDVISAAWNGGDPTPAFNNAGQVFNHDFFWASMSPKPTSPSGALAAAIDRDLGGLDAFKKDFAAAGATQFGSGWAWLVLDPKDGNKLKITKTPNAQSPLQAVQVPLLTIDVWEHAYYLDYQNRRPDFIQTFINELIDWGVVAKRFAAAGGK
jgi:Fe-Mn family superoxide dismutase